MPQRCCVECVGVDGGPLLVCTDLEVVDEEGNTPLLLSYFLNRTEAAKLLLAAGAAAKARGKNGWEAVEVGSGCGALHMQKA